MKPQEFFRWVVSKARPRIRYEPEIPPSGIPGIFEDDAHVILHEHAQRKYGERETAPPGRRLHWIATNDATGQLLKGDARNRPPMDALPRTPMAASTKKSAVITAPAPKVRRRDLRQRIKQLEGEIRALETGRKK